MIDAGKLYEMLLEAYGKPEEWSDDPFTVIIQAVLVQNTAWRNVEATTNEMGGIPDPDVILEMDEATLMHAIRSCGFYRAKGRTIKALAAWWKGILLDESTSAESTEELRKELMAINGVGEETADVILVYALSRPSFIIDAYSRRFMFRFGLDYISDTELRRYFTVSIPEDAAVYGNFHWLILEHCKTVCRKKTACSACILESACMKRLDSV